MITKRTIGTMAAIGGLTAAIALLSGQSPARADELADLRANEQLLQQRVDQLAQAQNAGAGTYIGPSTGGPTNVQMMGGSFPRSFLVPGTDTSIRVGGTITLDVKYNFTGGNPNQTTASSSNFGNNGDVNSAPLNQQVAFVGGHIVPASSLARSRGNSITQISPQQSKVNFETRTPTAWGEARTFMEFDWANGNQFAPGNNALSSTNNLIPRLRFAYATLGGLLAGQANSNFNDPDASTENISFGGMVGDPGITRVPQVRYTVPLAPWGIPGAFSASMESPNTEGWTQGAGTGPLASDASSQNPALTTCTATVSGVAGATATCALGAVVNPFKAPAPDLTATWFIPQFWGHMSFSAVVLPELQIKDGAFVDRSFTGYGVHFGGDVKPLWFGWGKDSITWQFVAGNGIGNYDAGNSTEFSLITNYPTGTATATQAAHLRAQTTVMWSGNAGYKHYWTPTLHSNFNFGILHHDINNLGGPDGFVCSGANRFSGGGGCALNKQLMTAAVNLIWNPVPFANIGIEYVHGERQVLSNMRGDVDGLISRVQVSF